MLKKISLVACPHSPMNILGPADLFWCRHCIISFWEGGVRQEFACTGIKMINARNLEFPAALGESLPLGITLLPLGAPLMECRAARRASGSVPDVSLKEQGGGL